MSVNPVASNVNQQNPYSGNIDNKNNQNPLPAENERNIDPKDEYIPGSATVSTDKVEAEIRKIKDYKKQVEQKLSSAKNNPEKREELEDELEKIDSQLKAKDNDAYRKQNAVVSNVTEAEKKE